MEIFGNAPLLRGDPAKREGGLVSGDSQKPPLNPPLTGGSITPLLILPVTLRFLAPLFAEFLPSAQIHWLSPRETFVLGGVDITGYMFTQSDITNEDAVMMLSISNDRELLFAEIDTVPDEYDADIATELFRIFDRKDYETRCYLASRNELE